MQFGVREGFLLAAAVLLLVLAVWGARRLHSRKYTTIRSNADPTKRIEPELDQDIPNSELPGGAARVVGYRDLEDIETINQRLREEVERNRPTLKSIELARSASGDRDPIERHAQEMESDEEIPVLMDPASEVQTPPEPAQDSLFEEADSAEEDQLDGETATLTESSSSPQDEQSDEPSEVLILNVMTSEEQPFQGPLLKTILFDAGLSFSESNFFQSISDEDGETRFIIANVFNPGTFDVDNMDEFSTIGLCFFQPLQTTHNNLDAFDHMLQIAGRLVTELGGQLCDENRSTLTNQTVEHYRSRIREFELKYRSEDR